MERYKHITLYASCALLLMLLLVSTVYAEEYCYPQFSPKHTDALLNQVPQWNAAFEQCHVQLISPVDKLFRTTDVVVSIERTDGSSEHLQLTVEDGALTQVKQGSIDDGWIITMHECGVDTILRHKDPLGVAAYQYVQGDIKLHSTTWGKKILHQMMRPVIFGAAKKVQTPVDIACVDDSQFE